MQKEEEPLILVVARFLLRLVGYLSLFISLPLWLSIHFVSSFGNAKWFSKASVVYLILFVPRMILNVLLFFVLYSTIIGPSYILAYFEVDHLVGFSFLSLLLSIITVVYSFYFKKSDSLACSIVPKTDLGELKTCIIESLLDIIHTLLFLFCVCGIIRIPALLYAAIIKKQQPTWRKEIQENTGNTLIDLFVLPFFVSLLPFIWRKRKVIRKINGKEDILYSGEIRKETIIQFAKLIGDLFGALLAIIVCCSIYRIPPLFARRLDVPPGASFFARRRKTVTKQFLLLLLDIITVVPLLCVVVSIYRIPTLIALIQMRRVNVSWTNTTFHRCVFDAFCELLVDIFFIILGSVVTLLVWRSVFLFYDLYHTTSARERRNICWKHFTMLFVDIIDLPFVLLSLIIVVTFWRSITLWVSLKKVNTRKERRWIVVRQFRDWILDIVCSFLSLFIFITVVRARSLYLALKSLQNPVPTVRRSGIDEDEDPTPVVSKTWHSVVFNEFIQLIQDIPIYLLSLLTLWRLPILIRRMINECENNYERRYMIIRYIFLTLKDIPALVLLTIMTASLWRIPFLFKAFSNYSSGDDEHQIVLNEFYEWVKDVPYAVISIITILCPWRIISFFIDAYKCTDQHERRKLCVMYAFAVVLDCVSLVFGVVILATLVRIKSWITYYKHMPDSLPPFKNFSYFPSAARFHLATCYAVIDLVSDLITILMFIATWIVVVKIPTLIIRCAKITHAKINNTEDSVHNLLRSKIQYDKNLYSTFGIHYYWKVAFLTLKDSLKMVPHILLLPFKILAIPCAIAYYYSLWRFPKSQDACWYNSSNLVKPIWRFQGIAKDTMNFLNMHVFLAASLFIGVFTIVNEIAVLIALFNAFLMFIITLASPLWNFILKKLPRKIRVGIKATINAIQVILFPLISLYCIVLIFAPLVVVIMYNYSTSSFYNHAIFQIIDERVIGLVAWAQDCSLQLMNLKDVLLPKIVDLYHVVILYAQSLEQYPILALHFKTWPVVLKYSWGISLRILKVLFAVGFNQVSAVVITSIMWFFVTTEGLTTSEKIRDRAIELFAPIKAVQWFIEGILAGRLFRTYKILLAAPTAWCYSHRKTFFIGEILMFPLFAAWTGVPLFVSYYLAKPQLYLASVPVFLFLVFIAINIISSSWKSLETTIDQKPILTVNKMDVKFEKYGIVLNLHCTKPANFVIKQSRLHLLGDSLWKGLSKIVGSTTISTFRYTFHPIILCDTFFPANVFNTGSENVTIPLHFGTEKQGWLKINTKYVLKPRLEQLVEKLNNPTVELFVEYGTKKTFSWDTTGVLFRVKFTISDLINAADGIQLKYD